MDISFVGTKKNGEGLNYDGLSMIFLVSQRFEGFDEYMGQYFVYAFQI